MVGNELCQDNKNRHGCSKFLQANRFHAQAADGEVASPPCPTDLNHTAADFKAHSTALPNPGTTIYPNQTVLKSYEALEF